jgi:hypothetical protein
MLFRVDLFVTMVTEKKWFYIRPNFTTSEPSILNLNRRMETTPLSWLGSSVQQAQLAMMVLHMLLWSVRASVGPLGT